MILLKCKSDSPVLSGFPVLLGEGPSPHRSPAPASVGGARHRSWGAASTWPSSSSPQGRSFCLGRALSAQRVLSVSILLTKHSPQQVHQPMWAFRADEHRVVIRHFPALLRIPEEPCPPFPCPPLQPRNHLLSPLCTLYHQVLMGLPGRPASVVSTRLCPCDGRGQLCTDICHMSAA